MPKSVTRFRRGRSFLAALIPPSFSVRVPFWIRLRYTGAAALLLDAVWLRATHLSRSLLRSALALVFSLPSIALLPFRGTVFAPPLSVLVAVTSLPSLRPPPETTPTVATSPEPETASETDVGVSKANEAASSCGVASSSSGSIGEERGKYGEVGGARWRPAAVFAADRVLGGVGIRVCENIMDEDELEVGVW